MVSRSLWIVLLFATAASGCFQTGGTAPDPTDTTSAASSTGTGSGSGSSSTTTPTLSNSDIVGNWRAACAVSSATSGGGGGSYLDTLNLLSNNTGYLQRLWYAGSTCSVVSGSVLDNTMDFVYSVGTHVADSVFGIAFTSTGVSTRPYAAGMVNWLNSTGCPSGPAQVLNTITTMNGISCAFYIQPNVNQVVVNLIKKTSSTTFSMGAVSSSRHGPGVWSGVETTPTSVSVEFTKQ